MRRLKARTNSRTRSCHIQSSQGPGIRKKPWWSAERRGIPHSAWDAPGRLTRVSPGRSALRPLGTFPVLSLFRRSTPPNELMGIPLLKKGNQMTARPAPQNKRIAELCLDEKNGLWGSLQRRRKSVVRQEVWSSAFRRLWLCFNEKERKNRLKAGLQTSFQTSAL
jgi:hypothetical protein